MHSRSQNPLGDLRSFAKKVNGCQLFTTFTKGSTLDVRLSSEISQGKYCLGSRILRDVFTEIGVKKCLTNKNWLKNICYFVYFPVHNHYISQNWDCLSHLWWFLIFDVHSSLQMLHQIGVFKNFAKFTEKQLCRSLFYNKVVGLHNATF